MKNLFLISIILLLSSSIADAASNYSYKPASQPMDTKYSNYTELNAGLKRIQKKYYGKFAAPNYSYTPTSQPLNTKPTAQNGSYYLDGTYFYDASKVNAKYKEIQDKYYNKYYGGTTIGYNEDGSTYPIVQMNGGTNAIYQMEWELINSPEYDDMIKDIETNGVK